MSCPFGGISGKLRNVRPQAAPPDRGYRVFSGAVWWRLVYWPWKKYVAQFIVANPQATRPNLARIGGRGVYFTDRDSLEGIENAVAFAKRAGLSQRAQTECNLYGCVIVEFEVPSGASVVLPPPAINNVQQGLTVGGAREWLLGGNIDLKENMVVTCVGGLISSGHGQNWFQLPL